VPERSKNRRSKISSHAGALIDALMRRHVRVECKDSAQVVWRTFCHTGDDQRSLIESSLNARRLLQKPDLAPDVSNLS
jgi:hypothetical protein